MGSDLVKGYAKNYGSHVEYRNSSSVLHRDFDRPAVEKVNRDEWYQAGKCHKIVWSDGHHKEWWFEGKKHRLDGPAIEKANGRKIWYIEGKEYTEEEFNKYVKDNG